MANRRLGKPMTAKQEAAYIELVRLVEERGFTEVLKDLAELASRRSFMARKTKAPNFQALEYEAASTYLALCATYKLKEA